MPEEISIDKGRYEELLWREKKLIALEHGGVQNWEWYWESLEDAGLAQGDDE